jgi:hypothetical protein
MESRGLVEFRYADGTVVTHDCEQYTVGPLTRGDQLEFDGKTWAMDDREDRDGVTVHLFSQCERDVDGLRARRRGRG